MQQKSDDIFAHADGTARRRSVLSEEIADFIQSGVSIVVGVVGPDGRALGGRALAARVEQDARIRVIYPQEGNAALTAAAASGGPVAVTFSAPLSHRTVQIKGFSSLHEVLEPEDEASVQRQGAAFAAILVAVGHPPVFVNAFSSYLAATMLVFSFPAEEAFEQTPGPGAGRSL
jgi:hypothetical protein